MATTYSAASLQALHILRDPGYFHWQLVPTFALVVYLYCVELGRRNWDTVIAGAGGLAIDFVGEIGNALWLRFSGYAPLWGEPGPTAYLILVGINIETALMFAVFGLAIAKTLPKDREARIWGLPSRPFIVGAFSLFCAAIEIILNAWGALTWDYSWWGRNVWSITLLAYAPCVATIVWLHDLKPLRAKLWWLCGICVFDVAALFVFVRVLRWI